VLCCFTYVFHDDFLKPTFLPMAMLPSDTNPDLILHVSMISKLYDVGHCTSQGKESECKILNHGWGYCMLRWKFARCFLVISTSHVGISIQWCYLIHISLFFISLEQNIVKKSSPQLRWYSTQFFCQSFIYIIKKGEKLIKIWGDIKPDPINPCESTLMVIHENNNSIVNQPLAIDVCEYQMGL